MKNNPYSLQLLSKRSVFATRDEAFEFINRNFKGKALWAEPAVFFYNTEDGIKMVLAIGCDNNGNICTLDNNELATAVSVLETLETEHNQLSADFLSALEAAGLELNENLISNRVEYKPNQSDNLIRGAESLAEAIEIISQYAQQIESMSIDDIKIFGNESDTANTTATLVDDSWVINTDVRLSSDRSIIVHDGGLSANIDVDVNEATNEITIRIGEVSHTYTLPGVNIISSATYDSEHKSIIIEFKDSSIDPITIPVGDIVETWVIENPVSSPIELHKHATPTEDKIYATIKLRSEDNIIGVDSTNGNMYVSRVAIENVVTDSMSTYDDAISTINDKVSANEASISELNTKVTENTSDITMLEAQTEHNTSEIARVENKVNTEIETARANEQTLSERITTLNSAISEEVNRAQGVETQLNSRLENAENQLSTVDSRINTAVTTAVNNERDARILNDEAIRENISSLNETLSNRIDTVEEQAHNYTDTEVHRVELETSIAIETAKNEAISTAAADATTKANDAKTYAETLVNTEKERAQEKETQLATSITNLQTEITTKTNEAKTYAETLVNTEKERAQEKETQLATSIAANSDAISALQAEDTVLHTEITTKVQEAKTYADSLTTVERERAQAAEAQLQEQLNHKIEKVELESEGDLIYRILVDDRVIGTINIPKDQFLKNASYDPTTKNIELVCETTEGERTLRINVADLVDEYTAGNGLRLEGNEFSIRINEDSEPYLGLTDEGLKITGINAALADKADKGDCYTKEESDARYLNGGSLDGYATEEEVEAIRQNVSAIGEVLDTIDETLDIINGPEYTDGSIANAIRQSKNYTDEKVAAETSRATTAEGQLNDKINIINGAEYQEGSIANAIRQSKNYTDEKVATETSRAMTAESELRSDINVINGNEAQEGSIANAIKQSKDYTDTKVLEEKSRAMTAEQELNDKINVLNGNEAQEGSVKNAIKQSKDYTDSKVAEEVTARSNEVSRLETLIAGKANTSDVYTKAEIDAKGYLTDANLALYATKSELNNEVSALESVNNAQNTRLDTIEAGETTQNTRLDNIEDELVKINVIDEDTNSIDVNVSKTNSGTKVKADLKLDSTQPNIIRISGNGVYATVDLTYNSATNTLSLNNGVETKNIQLSDHTLVNNGYYDSENRQIVLVVTANGETRNIAIPVSDLVNQISVSNTDNDPINLYMERNEQGVDVISATVNISTLENNAILNNNGTLYASKNASDMNAQWPGEGVVSIQTAIERLKTETDKVGDIEDDVEALQTDVNNIKNQIITINGDIDGLQDQVDANTQNIATHTSQISELTTNYNNLSGRVGTLENKVTSIEGDIEDIKGDITEINNIIGDYNAALGTIEQRLAAIENLLQNDLIDFNDRNANEDLTDDTIYVNGEPW